LVFELDRWEAMDGGVKAIADMLRRRHRSSTKQPEDFQVQNQKELIDTQTAIRSIAELRRMYPDAPVGLPEGAETAYSTDGHLVDCYLEIQADRQLMGPERTQTIIKNKGHYTWIYKTILQDESRIATVVAAHRSEMRLGEKIAGVRIVVSQPNGRIRGLVQVVGGALPDGWRLQALAMRPVNADESKAGARGIVPIDRMGGSAIVDEKGRFVVEAVPAGEYDLFVNPIRFSLSRNLVNARFLSV